MTLGWAGTGYEKLSRNFVHPVELRPRLFPVPGLAEEAGVEDFSGGFRGGRGRDVEDRPVGELGVLLGVRLAVRLPEGGAAVEDDVALVDSDTGVDEHREVSGCWVYFTVGCQGSLGPQDGKVA